MKPECRYFMDTWDRFREDRLTETERALIEDHLSICPECASRYRAVESIGTTIRSMEMDPFTKRRIAVAAADFRRPSGLSSPRRLFIRLGTGAVTALAVLLAGVFYAVSRPVLDEIAPVHAASDRSDANEASYPEECSPAFLEETGRREIALFPGTSFYLSDDAAIEAVETSASLAHFRLLKGHVLAEIGGHPNDFRFIVTLPHSEMEARGTVFSATCGADGTEKMSVHDGLVEVRIPAKAESIVISPGETLIRKKNRTWARRTIAQPDLNADEHLLHGGRINDDRRRDIAAIAAKARPHVKSGRPSEASDLVDKLTSDRTERISTVQLLAGLARAYRGEKKFKEAKDVYLRLIKAYPATDTAVDSLVALGQIEYRTLRLPKDALRHFKQYLDARPNGFLAETARAEQIRVLQSLGNWPAVIDAAEEYISAHAEGFGRPEVMRRRADALAKTGHCDKALAEYRRIIERWPGTLEAERAAKGQAACH